MVLRATVRLAINIRTPHVAHGRNWNTGSLKTALIVLLFSLLRFLYVHRDPPRRRANIASTFVAHSGGTIILMPGTVSIGSDGTFVKL